MRVTKDYVFFWKGWLSNFWRCKITATWMEPPIPGWEMNVHDFFCTEQYFMFMKACTFGDREIGERILNCSTPQEARNLGQKVRGYKDEVWAPIRQQVMFDANFMKYTQNLDLKEKLLNPEWRDKHFVEASPYDRIWAIGLGEEDPACDNPKNWKGTNLLGQCLDGVRKTILSFEKK